MDRPGQKITHPRDNEGWSDDTFLSLRSQEAKRAYVLASNLHHGVFRKNGEPYLVHINRSLQELDQYKGLLGDIDIGKMQMLVCLHDVIEDDDDGVELVAKELGIETLIEILWMSVPKKRVRDGVTKLIQRKPKSTTELTQFTAIHLSAANGKPTDDEFHDSLKFYIPGYWHKQWEPLYAAEYQKKSNEINEERSENATKEESKKEEQRDIFAKYIFGGMVENMPEYLFLVKCIERLDNLRDRAGLKDEAGKGLASYSRTVATTKEIYCKRLDIMAQDSKNEGFAAFAAILRLEATIGIDDIMRAVPEDVRNIVIPPSTST